jgi:diacylglycerol kinase (ATP)
VREANARGRKPLAPAAAAPRHGLAAFRASFGFAWDGIVETALHQRNMRVHVVAGLVVALVGSGVRLGAAEELALLMCVFLVLAAEVVNSALEALADLVTSERHDRARAAKDAGAGAVLVLAAGSVAVLAAVLVRAWPATAADWRGAGRQAALGVPLAASAALLLAPWRRGPAVDAALALLGSAALAGLATFTLSGVFTALAALLFGVALATARRRGRTVEGGSSNAPSG